MGGLGLLGCAEQFDPPSTASVPIEARILVGNTNGTVSVIEHGDDGNVPADPLDVAFPAGDMMDSTHNHIFVNVTNGNFVAAIDPVGEAAELKKMIPVGQRPVHTYRDPEGTRIWVLNDGDPSTGVDTVTPACNADSVASVSVIQNHDEGGEEGNPGAVLATICVGRGHHKAAFSYPTLDHPGIPHRAFISNIMDGTVSVIDNDPGSPDYLTVIGLIDLCDSNLESCDGDPATPNGAGPHGMEYSPMSGKIYNNNEDYGTENVIDPVTLAVEDTLDLLGFTGATHVSPDGRFVVVRGADRSSDPDHVIGKLTVIDTDDNSFVQTDLPDINPGGLLFAPDGTKIYIPSASTGSAAQKLNLKTDVILSIDGSALSGTTPIPPGSMNEITVGETTGGRSIGLHEHDGEAEHLFVTNRTGGTVSIVDAETETVVDTVTVGGVPTSLLVFSLEGDISHH
jgi:YVTN family beta-propeller protein